MTWHAAVAIVSGQDRPAWLEARKTRITSTDVAKAMSPSGWRTVVTTKLFGDRLEDNPFMAHGRGREHHIAEAALRLHGMVANHFLYDGNGNSATPDAIHPDRTELGEYKTSTQPLPATTPRLYRDQIYLAQHVFGATRTLLGWEHHVNGVPVDLEPAWRWIERDEERLEELLAKSRELAQYLTSEGLTLAY
jgi:hypothetical protein